VGEATPETGAFSSGPVPGAGRFISIRRLFAVLALLLLRAPHPNSNSFSAVRVEGAHVSVELHVQSRSVIEALGGDSDRVGRLAADEIEAARAKLGDYFLDRYRISVDTGGEPGRGRRLEGRVVSLVPHWRADMSVPEEWLEVQLAFEAGRAPRDVQIDVSLFAQENPFHRDVCELEWNDDPPARWLFGIDGPSWWYQPVAQRRPGVLAEFLRLGLRQLLAAREATLLLLALAVAVRNARGLVAVASAFLAAEVLALALAASGAFEPPARLAALVAAMSVAYVAAENLLFRGPAGRVPEAAVFGLGHGLLAAVALEPWLRDEVLAGTATTGFALGLAAAQAGAVVILGAVLGRLPGDRSHGDSPRAWLAPRAARTGLSLLALVLGAWLFVLRAGWLG